MIAHDEMKDRMIQFAIDYEQELARKFDLIVTTGTTGARIKEAAPLLKELVSPRKSGPKGGDIEIATEIILGLIETVIFFVDPLHAHPHSDDIRVVFGACMMNPVRMLSNERQARDWMERLPEP
jgi:methylglyoxal synthase